MRRVLLYSIALMFAISAWSCTKTDPEGPAVTPDEEIGEEVEEQTNYAALIVGEWCFVDPGYKADVYISFEAEFTFDIYQKIGDGRQQHYTGTWSIEENIISGVYSDGTEWGSSYSLEFMESDTMLMTALNGSQDVMTYIREEIPADVKGYSPALMLNSQPQYRWL